MKTYAIALVLWPVVLTSKHAGAQVVNDMYGPYSIWVLQTLAGQALIALLAISGVLLLRRGRKSQGVARQRGWVYGGLLCCLAAGTAAVEIQVHQTPEESWREVRVHVGPQALRVW
jgi:hypothetical protein